jgi:hypothetical protein
VSEIEENLGIRQPTLSQQIGALREAGVIEGRRRAKAGSTVWPMRGRVISSTRCIASSPPRDSRHLRHRHPRGRGLSRRRALLLSPASSQAAPGDSGEMSWLSTGPATSNRSAAVR